MKSSVWQLMTRITGSLFPPSYRWPATDIRLGRRALHLVGSIHMGTQDMHPLPARLLKRLKNADALIVEADITQGSSPFEPLGEEPPLDARLTPEALEKLDKLCAELNLTRGMFDTLPAWQIALMLQAQQAQQLGLRPQFGVDYQLLKAANAWHKPVIELEGADTQVALLKALPDGGKALLMDTLLHWHTNARLLQTMISWWLDTPPKVPHIAMPSTFSQALNDTLIGDRNVVWRDKLDALPPGNYVVAVGALHLYGEDNLPQLLRRR